MPVPINQCYLWTISRNAYLCVQNIFGMTAKDINKRKFDKTTTLKLNIFRDCFREWYPVFLHDPHTTKIYVYDMFAGSGEDSVGDEGSPLILVNEAKGGEDRKHCNTLLRKDDKEVTFTFNELLKEKSKKLESLLRTNLSNCRESCGLDCCCYSNALKFTQQEFHTLVYSNEVKNILKNNRYAKFILLDQYGFKEVDTKIFRLLVNSPKTDIVFFIASSFVKRFAQEPAVKKYFDTNKLYWDETKPKECHRVIKEYYAALLPNDRDYYLHAFTMKKGSNYYGLIFCSGHSLGMEKFMKVCWNIDNLEGESNCNVGGSLGSGSLFPDLESKSALITKKLRELILSEVITTNLEGLNYALKLGCQPRVFVEAIKLLKKEGLVSIDGDFNESATNIHRAKEYKIIVVK